jgi:hypothetical protein
MVVDAWSTLCNVVKVVQFILKTIDGVKTNKKKCKKLAQRLSAIVEVLNSKH